MKIDTISRKTWHRFLALVLTVSIILTSVNIDAYNVYGSADIEYTNTENYPEDTDNNIIDTENEHTQGEDSVADDSVLLSQSDITDDDNKLTLGLSDWWYDTKDHEPEISSDGRNIDFSGYAYPEPASEQSDITLGAKLVYNASNVIRGDYFEIIFPSILKSLTVSDEIILNP